MTQPKATADNLTDEQILRMQDLAARETCARIWNERYDAAAINARREAERSK